MMLSVIDGYLSCPYCRANKLQRVRPDTKAQRLQIYCRKCKHEILVDMESGKCYMSRGQ